MKQRMNPKIADDLAEVRLKRLAALPDDEIDFSDIPLTTANDWENAERGKFYRPKTSQQAAT